jgi:ATP-dependent Lon protease
MSKKDQTDNKQSKNQEERQAKKKPESDNQAQKKRGKSETGSKKQSKQHKKAKTEPDQQEKKPGKKSPPPSKKQESEKRAKQKKKELDAAIKKAKAQQMAREEVLRRQKARAIKAKLPSTDFTLPVIPLRQGLLFPHTESVLSFGRSTSLKALEHAQKQKKLVVLVSQKDPEVDQPQAKDLYQVGTLALIERSVESEDVLNVLTRGLQRVEILNYQQFEPYITARISRLETSTEEDEEIIALARHLKKTFREIVQMGKPVEFLSFIKLMSGLDASPMTDQICSTLDLDTDKKQELLETVELKPRMKKVIAQLNHEMKVLEIEKDVVHKTRAKFNQHMRENVLRERLRTIKKELGEYDDGEEEAQTYREQLAELDLEEKTKEKIERDISRLEQMSPRNPQSGYISTWLETIFDLPWDEKDKTDIHLSQAQKILDKNHYGLEDVKDRVLEYISVLQLKQAQEASGKSQKQTGPESKRKEEKGGDADQEQERQDLPTILCFVGPPGVGKTSIGRAIAQALGRKFTKISLGGIKDEAEIRGHRRTYVGAMPGRIIKGIEQAGSMNPVFILDEIDKVGNDFRGDPSAALLEVLDPEQNQQFEDHYLDIPFDLSEVIFITTANTLDTIPPALKDRLEVIRYPGYTFNEKFNIAKKHLMDKVLAANGLLPRQVDITDASIKKIIQRYTKEAGVRELERQLSKAYRKVAKKIVEQSEANDTDQEADSEKPSETKAIKVTPKLIKEFLGPEKYDQTLAEEADQVGVATGLAWTRTGGDVLFIEVALTPSIGKSKIQLTGKLGEVMKESAHAALTFIKAQAEELGIEPEQFEQTDVHIHVPEGAVPKDGPSAGITIATAIASAFTERPVKREIAMTGEITLRGRVLRIGGLKEKVIAAHLAGIRQIAIPEKNERNLVDIPDSVKDDMDFQVVADANQVLDLALLPANEST